ncbi:MAG TPA: hypothetical protein V6D03_06410 [Candidatus Caenarcaniphilales bacterium]
MLTSITYPWRSMFIVSYPLSDRLAGLQACTPILAGSAAGEIDGLALSRC